MDAIIYACWDQIQTMLVKRATDEQIIQGVYAF